MAAIEKRVASDGAVTYRARVRLKGYPPQSATFERRTDAKQWAEQTQAAMREGRYFAVNEAKRHTVADLIERYLSSPQYLQLRDQYSRKLHLNWWREQIGFYRLIGATPALIAEQRDLLKSKITLQGKERSSASVNRHLAALSAAMTLAYREWGWLRGNPCRKVSRLKEPPGRVRYLNDDERARLLAACRESKSADLYHMVVLALSTGMRRGELLSLRWLHVDLKRRVIYLENPKKIKNETPRALPLHGPAYELLSARAKLRKLHDDRVFPENIKDAFVRAVERAGIEDFRFHDLRHSAASYLAMNGASTFEIAEVLGHKTLEMVKRYAHLSESHVASVVERMNRRVFGADHGDDSETA